VVNGDVIFDLEQGSTIFSTEEIFSLMAEPLRPERILLAGIEEGVFQDYPACTRLVQLITPDNFSEVFLGLRGSAGVDVTGGMTLKVRAMLDLVQALPGLEAVVFSASRAGQLQRTLTGETPGTLIRLAS
jgi:isopentenyl phosphate kinase